MELRAEVIIIGGGLAGLSSAIHLCNAGKQVVLIEKNAYPQHKVCGEYISNEVLPYLQYLDADPAVLSPSRISRLQVSNLSGNSCETNLPHGGFGISRYKLDEYLHRKALAAGCTIIHDRVKDVHYRLDQFEVYTLNGIFQAKVVLGAFGKREQLDHALDRKFVKRRSPWLAVKAHYKGVHPNDLVALHNFHGGYCGVSKVENDIINVCYLVNYDSFKKFKNIREHQQQILFKNLHLKRFFENAEMNFEAPLSISQISFEVKEKVKDHVLMIGDTAGLIHPLCGNGMSMAIHAAGICASLVLDYLDNRISSRLALEKTYTQQWNAQFKWRLQSGKILSGILLKPEASEFVMKVLVKFPALFKPMIRMTHGSPLHMR
jgi:flavin-dependent dehydrogenase